MIHCPAGQVKKTLIVPKGCDQVIRQPKVNIFNPEVQKKLKWDDPKADELPSAGDTSTHGHDLKSDGYAPHMGGPPPTFHEQAAPTNGESAASAGQMASVRATLAAVRHEYCVVLS